MSEEGKGAIIFKLFEIKKQFFHDSKTIYLDTLTNCTIKLFDYIDNSKNEIFWYNSTTNEWNDEIYCKFIYNLIVVIYATEEIGEETIETKEVVKCTARAAVPEGMKVFHELHKDPYLKKFLDRFISTNYLHSPKNVLKPLLENILKEHNYLKDQMITDLIKTDSNSKYFLLIRDLFFSCIFLREHTDRMIKKEFISSFDNYPILIRGLVKIYDLEKATAKKSGKIMTVNK